MKIWLGQGVWITRKKILTKRQPGDGWLKPGATKGSVALPKSTTAVWRWGSRGAPHKL